MGHFFIPLRSSSASMVGSCPRKRLYSVMGCSVPPRESMQSRKRCAVCWLKMPSFLNTEKASASSTSAHLYLY